MSDQMKKPRNAKQNKEDSTRKGVTAKKEAESKGLVDGIWDLFSSMKTGLVLLGILVVVAGIGTIVPQESSDPNGAAAASQIWKTLGFTDLYSTVWFRVLLGILCLNLIICSIQRFGSVYKRSFHPTPPQGAGQVPNKLKEEVSGRISQEQVTNALHKTGFKVVGTNKGETWGFVGLKRHLGYWGSLITHLAFVIIAVGALIGTIYGVKGFLAAGAGETVPIKQIEISKGVVKDNFSVKINSAEDRKLSDGTRDNWYTSLSILENGKEVQSGTLSVNHPFRYAGYTFYQSSFYTGASFNITVDGKSQVVVLRNEDSYQIPGTDYYLYLAAMKDDTASPAILYQVYQGLSATQPMQTNKMVPGDKFTVGDKIQATFTGLAGYTGLQVKKDPGVWIVWIGFALGMIGLLLSFYWRPVTIYGILKRQENGEAALVAGTAGSKLGGKNTHDFNAFMQEIKG